MSDRFARGYFTIAQGPTYIRAAYALALSLKLTQPEGYGKLTIGVTQEDEALITPKQREVFDGVALIPWMDHAKDSKWKLENEWKAIHMTPYDATIKLDADMLFTGDVSHWWPILDLSEGVFATAPLNYRGEVITSDYYRKVFTESKLPNVYTAAFYFKKTPTNFELFELAEIIFSNWEYFFYEYLEPENRPTFVSTDVVFALAAKILNYTELNTFPSAGVPTFVHAKSRLNGWDDVEDEDWTTRLPLRITNDFEVYMGEFKQTLPLHYHVKHALTDEMVSLMEKKLGL